MNDPTSNLLNAQQRAMDGRPAIGGFPFLAETLRRAGVTANVWHLPSCQSVYYTESGIVVQQLQPLAVGTFEVPDFDEAALVAALRADQAGESSFEAFLSAIWCAGVLRYDVDLTARCVTYFGSRGEQYRETYPALSI